MLLIIFVGSALALAPPVPKAVPADFTGAAAAWMTGLRVPAALVAGSALQNFVALQREVQVDLKKDSYPTRLVKRLAALAYVSSFILEIMVVFVTTVTSTFLLSNAEHAAPINPIALTATGLLHRELEFEYVTMRLCFLQGILNWLAGFGLRFLLPVFSTETSLPDKAYAHLYSRAVFVLTVFMISFYERHLSYYGSYATIIARFFSLAFSKLSPFSFTASATFIGAIWTLAGLVNAIRLDLEFKPKP